MHLDKPNSEFPYILGEYQLMVMPAEPLETHRPRRHRHRALQDRRARSQAPHHHGAPRGVLAQGLPVRRPPRGGELARAHGRRAQRLPRRPLRRRARAWTPACCRTSSAFPGTKIDFSEAGDQALMILPKHEGSPFNDKRIRQALVARDRPREGDEDRLRRRRPAGSATTRTSRPPTRPSCPYPKRDVAQGEEAARRGGLSRTASRCRRSTSPPRGPKCRASSRWWRRP